MTLIPTWYNGVVKKMLGATIEVTLPNGGTILAPNHGFDRGDEIAFTLDAISKKVARMIPKEMAEFKNLLAIEPQLSLAIHATQTEEEEEEPYIEDGDEETGEMEANHGIDDDSSSGQGAEIDPDNCGEEHRDLARRWEDLDDDPSEEINALGTEDGLYLEEE